MGPYTVVVNVWVASALLALALRKAPHRNEVAGALEVLALLDLEGTLVTAEALHCRPDTAGPSATGWAIMCWPSRATATGNSDLIRELWSTPIGLAKTLRIGLHQTAPANSGGHDTVFGPCRNG